MKEKTRLRTNRLHEKRLANNGQCMTIVRYNGVNDIDVLFEDNTLVEHCAYKQFVNGEIKNPNIPVGTYTANKRETKNHRIGETCVNTQGLNMEIIGYETAHNVTVKFENGIILCKRNYNHFKNGRIKMPTIFPNGIEIIELAYVKDDVWFYICKHAEWTENKILAVSEICPEPITTSKNRTERRVIYGSLLNQEVVASNGMKIKCVADNGSKDITVEFEDGERAYHQRRTAFLEGHIRHPSKQIKTKRNKEQHLGEVWYDRNGRKMTIVEYFSNSNVTIEYDDGVRLYNKEYRIIKKGADLYPRSRVGEKKLARNGLMMEIIDDHIWHDIKIRFEDDTIVSGCTYAQFTSGAIKHPKLNAKTSRLSNERLGAVRVMKNGLALTTIEYRNAKDVDFRYENGMIIKNRDWSSFEKQLIAMPHFIGSIFIKEFAYQQGNDWYYIVSKDEWDEDRILSVNQMYELEGVNCASSTKAE